MGFIFSEVFWGVLLIVLGVSFIIKVVFNVNIPVFRIFFAFFFIFLGIRFLIGGGFDFERSSNTVIFNDSQITVTKPSNEYNVIFGRGTFDLSEITLTKKVTKVAVNTIFGGGIIKLNPEIPTKIEVDSVFAEARMPDQNSNFPFGSHTFTTENFDENQDYLLIKASVIFGGLEIFNH